MSSEEVWRIILPLVYVIGFFIEWKIARWLLDECRWMRDEWQKEAITLIFFALVWPLALPMQAIALHEELWEILVCKIRKWRRGF